MKPRGRPFDSASASRIALAREARRRDQREANARGTYVVGATGMDTTAGRPDQSRTATLDAKAANVGQVAGNTEKPSAPSAPACAGLAVRLSDLVSTPGGLVYRLKASEPLRASRTGENFGPRGTSAGSSTSAAPAQASGDGQGGHSEMLDREVQPVGAVLDLPDAQIMESDQHRARREAREVAERNLAERQAEIEAQAKLDAAEQERARVRQGERDLEALRVALAHPERSSLPWRPATPGPSSTPCSGCGLVFDRDQQQRAGHAVVGMTKGREGCARWALGLPPEPPS